MLNTTATHTYEFPSETMFAPFGAGWTLSGSSTRPIYFPVGSTLDDIISIFNGWQDPGATTLLTKTVVPRTIVYTRAQAADTVTLQYPTISKTGAPDIAVTGSVTVAEQRAFQATAVGTNVTGWIITTILNHPIVTQTTLAPNRSAAENPRFLSMFEAIDYTRVITRQ